MTDDDKKFEEWYEKAIWGNEDYRDSLRIAFLAALAIGREEGRKERTVEITEKLAPWVPSLEAVMLVHYPECFEKGERE